MTIWIASPTGTSSGAGTVVSPRDLASLVGVGSPVLPDDEIWCRVGSHTPLTAGATGLTYLDGRAAIAGKGCYTLRINGTSGHQILIRNYPGEAARINGGLHAVSGQASYITIQGIEIAPTPTTRVFATQNDVDYPAIYITAPGIKIYNCYLHDLETIYPMEAAGFDMNGCVVGWNGFYATALGYNAGYNLYAHNHGGGVVNIHKNVFLFSFSSVATQYFYNLHFFGSAADVRDYDIRYNTIIWGGTYVGNVFLTNSGNKFRDNYLMGGRAFVQALIDVANANPSDIEILDNYIWDRIGSYCIYTRGFKTIDVQRNQVVNSGVGEDEWGDYYPNNNPISVTRNNNTYWGTNGSCSFYFNGACQNLAGWRTATGFDLLSTQVSGLPTSNVVALTVCDHGKRGFVTVQNFLGSASVTIDLTPLGLSDGARCRYTNTLNMAEYVDFVYNADLPNLTISMAAADWSLRSPTAYDSPTAWPPEPFPAFGAWLVEEIDTGTPLTARARAFTLSVKER